MPVSTPPSVIVGPACRASQLVADLEDIERAGDSNYGWLILRDVSAAPCQLTGTVSIVGLSGDGTVDTRVSAADVVGGLLLSPLAAAVPNSALPPASEHVGFLVPGSADSITVGPSAGADCNHSDEIVPTTFRIDINGTGTITTNNGALGSASGRLEICQGQLDAGGPVTGEPH